MMQKTKKYISSLISKGKTEKAISQLHSIVKGEASKKLIILKATYYKLKQEKELNLVSREEYSVGISKLNHSLLQLMDEIILNKESIDSSHLRESLP